MKQSLEAQIGADKKDMSEEKATKAAAEEGKATAEGDLAVTKKELANAKETQKTFQGDCMTTASDHEATVAARTAELKVIDEAKKILKESTGGAESQTYSFVQVA